MKIYIGVLTMGDVHHYLAQMLNEIVHTAAQQNKYEVTVMYSGRINICDNRHQIIREFLKTDADYLLMIDSDNPPTKNPVPLAFLDKDIIACPTPMYRDNNIMFNIFDVVEGGYKSKMYNKEELVECDRVGGGCIMIARRVLEQMKVPFQIIYDENGKLVESEDFSFSRRAKEQGFTCFAHWGYICNHFKTMNLLDLITKNS